MIKIYYKKGKNDKLSTLPKFKPGAWIDVQNADDDDLEEITRLTGLSYYDLRDSLDSYEMPRIERQDEVTLIYLRYPSDSTKTGLHTEVLSILITQDFLITISPGLNKQSAKIKTLFKNVPTSQRVHLLMKLFLDVTNLFTSNIKTVRNNVFKRTRNVKEIKATDIIALTESEEVLDQYLSSLSQINSLFNTISTGKFFPLVEKESDILQDVSIGIKQSMDICQIDLHSIDNLRESYQIIFTNRLNKNIQLLTSLTIILTVPTLVGSLFGMNVTLPFQENPNAFGFIICISVTVCIFLIVYFKKNGWM